MVLLEHETLVCSKCNELPTLDYGILRDMLEDTWLNIGYE
ncbi:hypothetical protein Closa_1771 [[Clostridium] saccharolyticum WM1]|uniref:Uncharacterized protein n=1 Tax=Lacrimispora saccharolytica (strain ATCC 35040 / DSM 2544 / NRCC 2533 / WM1) TaxID=610130 RepID=D9QZA5_LACSW|nr:hypothetical protein Closa_1771 [[Clostridium] saccharolyticum WM1]